MVDITFRNEILPILNCALSVGDFEHLCQDPIILSCGHHICKACFVPETTVKCNICNQMNTRDLNQNVTLQLFEAIFKTNLNQLFVFLSEKFKTTLVSCKNMIYNHSNTINTHCQFIKDEIFIKIESLKIELDNLYDTFCNELNEKVQEWKESINIEDTIDFDQKQFESDLMKLEENIKKQENMSKENLYYYQNQIKLIQNKIGEIKSKTLKLTFTENSYKIEKEFIGELFFEGNDDSFTVNKLKTKHCKKLDIVSSITDIIFLPNDYFLLVDSDRNNLLLYDSNMNYQRKIDKIDNKIIKIRCVATDRNYLFMSDHDNRNIIKTDLEFNLLATFGKDLSPYGICCYNDKIFVCDYDNKRIQKLDSDLIWKESFRLNYYPWYIKNINNVAFLRPNESSSVYFYDLNNFNLIKKYDGHNGIIGHSQTHFYEYYPPDKKFYVYTKNGQLVKSMEMEDFGLITTSNNNGSIVLFKSKLYLQHYSSKFIFVFQ